MHDHEHSPSQTSAPAPRSATGSAPVAGGVARHVLQLQRTAGNRGVTELLDVQRDDPPGGTAAPAEPTAGGTGETIGDGSKPVSINAPMVNLNTAMTRSSGVLQVPTLIADSVIASNYTPGAGNVW